VYKDLLAPRNDNNYTYMAPYNCNKKGFDLEVERAALPSAISTSTDHRPRKLAMVERLKSTREHPGQ